MLSFGLVSCGFSAIPLVCEDEQTPWVNNICLWHGLRDDNPDLEDGKGPIEDALHQIDCGEEGAFGPNVQSGADVTVGSSGLLDATLSPVETHFNEAGMCVVNVHWHLGAEHKNVGTYDIDGEEWMEQHGKTKPKGHGANVVPGHGYGYGNKKGAVPLGEHDDIDPGNFCPGYDENDPAWTTEYDWEYCTDMNVGFTYEIHWPHSSLGACGTSWQMQSHFMDGVLCKANEADMDPGDAVAAVLNGTAKIGVRGMVVMVVNDAAYDYPEWNMMEGWHPDLVTDVAIYQGSTTGQKHGNDFTPGAKACKGTGGAVTWQMDRGCHKVSAKSVDNLCKQMLANSEYPLCGDSMKADTYPHNARETTVAAITTSQTMEEGVDFGRAR